MPLVPSLCEETPLENTVTENEILRDAITLISIKKSALLVPIKELYNVKY